jgi:hypothetical protein
MVPTTSTVFRASIKSRRSPAEEMIMSNDEPRTSSTPPAVNQFGTPVGQFGSSPGPAGARNQFGTPMQPGTQHPYGWAPAVPPAPPRRRSGGGLMAAVTALVAVAAVAFLVRYVVFPDLSKPIALPGTVAGVMPMGAAGAQPVTLQSKDREGRAVAMGVYADDVVAPRTMVVVTAGRMKDMGSGQITTATTTVGEVTCTDDLDTATLMQQSPGLQGPDRAAMRGLTTGAACWRTSRHLTVLVVALSADGTAKPVATQAVSEAWRAI